MVLLIDIGNTNINSCIFNGKSFVKLNSIPSFDFEKNKLKQLLSKLEYKINDVIISSVVPINTEITIKLIENTFFITPIVINSNFKSDINICLENHRTLGIDRFVNAVAAHDLYKNDNVIVIDFGTATTYDFIRSNGNLEFGLICPGIGICSDALYEKTAQLPKIKFQPHSTIVAKNTYDSVSAGNYYSKIGEVEYIINNIKKELDEKNIKVVATGGYVDDIKHGTKLIDIVNHNLIFDGMVILYKKFISDK